MGPQENWQSQVFKPFQKAERVGAALTSRGGMMFQKEEAMAEKFLLLDPTSHNSLADRIHNIPFLLAHVGLANPIGEIWFLRYPGPMS